MSIGERIRNKRIELGLTQDELAKKLGYASRSSVNKMENSRDLPLKKVQAMANALGVTPAYLMGWEEKEIYSPGVPGQVNLLNVPICSSDISINESNLIEALRQLNKVAPDEAESLYDIFTCIPTLPVELRKDIWEYSYLTIRKYHKEQMKKKSRDVL